MGLSMQLLASTIWSVRSEELELARDSQKETECSKRRPESRGERG